MNLLALQDVTESEKGIDKTEQKIRGLLASELSPELAKKRGVAYFVELLKVYDTWEV